MNFSFNGTSSFDKIWDILGNCSLPKDFSLPEGFDIEQFKTSTRHYKFEGNKLIVNVAGFYRDEIKVDFDPENALIEIECKGDSDFYGKELIFGIGIPEEFDIQTPEQIKMSFREGLVIIEFEELEKPEAKKTRLNFS